MDELTYYFLYPALALMLLGLWLTRKENPVAKRWGAIASFGTILLIAIGVLIPLVQAATKNPWPSLPPVAFVVGMTCLFGISTLLRIRPTKNEEEARFAGRLAFRLTLVFVYGVMIFGAGWFIYMIGEWFSHGDPTLRWTISGVGALVLIALIVPLGILSSMRRRQERIARARSNPLPDDAADGLFTRVLDAELAVDGIRRSTLLMSVTALGLVVVSAFIAFWLPAQLEHLPDTSPAPWATGVILGVGIGLGALLIIGVLYGPFLFGSIASYRRAFLSESERKAAEDRMLNRH